MNNNPWQSGGGIETALGLIFFLLFLAGMITLVIFVWGMIFKRAGYSFAMSLLMFIPFVNVIWLLIFAFSRWPIQKELDMYRTRGFPMEGYPQQPQPPLPPKSY